MKYYAESIKAKKLKPGMYLMVLTADDHVTSQRILTIREHSDGWIEVEVEGNRGWREINGRTRVVIWR